MTPSEQRIERAAKAFNDFATEGQEPYDEAPEDEKDRMRAAIALMFERAGPDPVLVRERDLWKHSSDDMVDLVKGQAAITQNLADAVRHHIETNKAQSERIAHLANRLDTAERERDSLRQSLDNMTAHAQAVSRQLEEREERIKAGSAENRRLIEELSAARRTIRALQSRGIPDHGG